MRASSLFPATRRRHNWTAFEGNLYPEVLEWLRAEFRDCFPNLEVTFQGKGEEWKTESGRKFLLAGKGPQCATSSMCGLRLATFPLDRVLGFVGALNARNGKTFGEAMAAAGAALKAAGLGGDQDAQDFLGQDSLSLFNACLELQVAYGGAPGEQDWWSEEAHQDLGRPYVRTYVLTYERTYAVSQYVRPCVQCHRGGRWYRGRPG